MKKYKLSIIIPVYNVEKYIRRNIESIIDAGLSNIEVILINDGSLDSSCEICKEYAEKIDYISVYNQTNGGQGKGRNTGMEHATGEWIYFVDADDFLVTQGLKNLVLYLEHLGNNGDVVLFNTLSYYESSDTYAPFTGWQYDANNDGLSGRDYFLNVLKKNPTYGYCVWFYVFRFSTVRDINLKFDAKGTSNDVEFTFNLWNISRAVYYIDENVYAYRREQPNSITHMPSEKWMLTLLRRIGNNLYQLGIVDNINSEYKQYVLLSLFNLYMVVVATMAKVDYPVSESLFESIKCTDKKMRESGLKVSRSFGAKYNLFIILNRLLSTKVLIQLWRIRFYKTT